ncbi:unnamed protein product [Arctogadus glacialis]
MLSSSTPSTGASTKRTAGAGDYLAQWWRVHAQFHYARPARCDAGFGSVRDQETEPEEDDDEAEGVRAKNAQPPGGPPDWARTMKVPARTAVERSCAGCSSRFITTLIHGLCLASHDLLLPMMVNEVNSRPPVDTP